MNIQKFTQKSLEAIQSAQTIATENQNSQVEQEHLLLALLEQENSLIKELLKKMGKDVLEQEVRNKFRGQIEEQMLDEIIEYLKEGSLSKIGAKKIILSVLEHIE